MNSEAIGVFADIIHQHESQVFAYQCYRYTKREWACSGLCVVFLEHFKLEQGKQRETGQG